MVLRSREEQDAPDLPEVLAALDDQQCREIVRALEEPMTAGEVAETCDIPRSTTYRKLDLLTEASLLEERTVLDPDGHHSSEYAVAFEEVVVALEDDRAFEVAISRPPRDAENRLAAMWSEVRKET